MPRRRYTAEAIIHELRAADVLIESCGEYNTVRPHSSLDYRPPAPEAVVPREEIPDLKEAGYTAFQTGPRI